MKKLFSILLMLLVIAGCGKKAETVCVLETSLGEIVFRFFEKDAPNTSLQIQAMIDTGFYNQKPFYRVVKGHVIQCGGGGNPLKAEFNERPHIAGTVGLARADDPHSGDSSFYICLAPRPHLDGQYTVFGQVVEGMDVLFEIGKVDVIEKWYGEDQNIAFHEPAEAVFILNAYLDQRRI